VVSIHPIVQQETEDLQKELPSIFPACIVTRSQMQKEKQTDVELENVPDSRV